MNFQHGALFARSARLLRDTGGNILPLAAVGMVLIASMIGGGVDMSRTYMVKNRLQAACDAAALAGRRAVASNGYDTTAKAQATSYFNVNFDQAREGTRNTSFSSASTDSGNRVNGTASTTVDMLLMKMFGYEYEVVNVTCTTTMGVGNSDVTMVLDVTTSMDSTLAGSSPSQTRIQALRAAMKNFYTTVKTATTGSNARIRYSFVPYSTTVNVGHLLNASYIRNSWPIQSRVAAYRQDPTQVADGYGTPTTGTPTVTYSTVQSGSQTTYNSTKYNNNSSGLTSCNNARPTPNPTAWINNGTAAAPTSSTVINGSNQQVTTTVKTQPQKRTVYVCALNNDNPKKNQIYKYDDTRNEITTTVATANQVYKTVYVTVFDHWDYKQITYDTSTYKTFTAVTTLTGGSSTPSNVSSTWNGCIEERKSSPSATFSFSTLLGMNPDVNDLDLDTVPDGDVDTQWAPMWGNVAYYRTKNGSLNNSAVTTTGSAAAAYCPAAAKLLTTMTQTEFNAYTDTVAGGGYTYHDIGLIWGGRLASPDGLFKTLVNEKPTNGSSVARHLIFMTDGEMCPTSNVYSAYGVEYNDRRVTTDGGGNLYCDSSGADTDTTYKAYAARHNSRFKAVCDAIKAKGIRLWVIVFATATTSDLTYCASSNSAFTASNSTQLNAAFQEIAKQVGELRVVS